MYEAELKPRRNAAGLWPEHHGMKEAQGREEGPAIQAWFRESCGQKAGHVPMDTDFP